MDGMDSRPVPDPTVLTTEALMREIANLRTQMMQLITSNQELTIASMLAAEKAVDKATPSAKPTEQPAAAYVHRPPKRVPACPQQGYAITTAHMPPRCVHCPPTSSGARMRPATRRHR